MLLCKGGVVSLVAALAACRVSKLFTKDTLQGRQAEHVMQSASVQAVQAGSTLHQQSGQLEQLHKSSPSAGAQEDQVQAGRAPAGSRKHCCSYRRALPAAAPASPKRSRQPSKATTGTRGAAMAAWADITAACFAWATMKGGPEPSCQDPVPNTPAAVSRVRRRGDTTMSCSKRHGLGVSCTGSCRGQGVSAKQQQQGERVT